MLTALVLAAGVLGSPVDDPFVDLTYEAALARAREEKKLLFVDFTATWCQPCKRMEKETWGDEGVRKWLAGNAISIQIDVDQEPELTREFEVEAMPTVVAVRDGETFDRIIGYRDAAAFLAWGDKVQRGERSTDGLLDRSRELAKTDDVRARYDIAGELARAKFYDEALAHFLWVWPASREVPAMTGVRVSFMIGEIARLVGKHEPARKAFFEVLDELQLKVSGADGPHRDDWGDWKAMCEGFGERARVVDWYAARRSEGGKLFADIERTSVHDRIIGDVFEVLLKEDRPIDAVNLFDDVRIRAQSIVGRHTRMLEVYSSFEGEQRDQMAELQRNSFAADMSQIYGALLAADRPEQAADVARMLLETLDHHQSRTALVRAGIEMLNKPHDSFAPWLDEAEAAGANVRTLRRRLERLTENAVKATDAE